MTLSATALRLALAVSAAGACSAAVWAAPVEIGTLTCSFAAAASPSTPAEQVGEGRDIECRFRGGLSAPEESYVGSLRFVGRADRVFEKGAIMLVAKAPATMKVAAGSLQQQYAAGGRSEGSAQGPLVGERDASIVLHPLAQRFGQPSLALGQPLPGLIITMELRLKSAPA
jgi:hypothetical protein